MKFKVLLTSLALLASQLLWASTTCFPENDLYITPNQKTIKTVTKAEFDEAIKDIEDLYTPIFKDKYSAELDIERDWEDGTVNAYAQQIGNVWKVKMFGGLARHEHVTQDGFRAVICHEVGHHIAGAPRKSSRWGGTSWASNEGQSDYFATSKCLRKLFESQREETVKFYNEIKSKDNLVAKKKCDEVFSSEVESAVCLRTSLAGKSLAKLLGSLRGNADVEFSTPDQSVVSATNHNHPAGQCRLDTYFHGSLCDKSHEVDPSMTDAATGYCVRSESYVDGVRPLCWYKP